jgi:hypothetical protein
MGRGVSETQDPSRVPKIPLSRTSRDLSLEGRGDFPFEHFVRPPNGEVFLLPLSQWRGLGSGRPLSHFVRPLSVEVILLAPHCGEVLE